MGTAATSLAAEMHRLLQAFTAPSDKPANRDKGGRGAAGAAEASGGGLGDQPTEGGAEGGSPPELSGGSSSADAPADRLAEDGRIRAAARAEMGATGGSTDSSVGQKHGSPEKARRPQWDIGGEHGDDDFNLVIEDVD